MVELAEAGGIPALNKRAEKSWHYQLGRLVVTRFQLFQLAVLVLMAINVFYRLSSAVVSDMDEARYGVAASEMLDAHNWLVPTYGGRTEYWNLKPPLGYWLIQASYSIFGRSVFALRLPAALCALGVVLLTMTIGRRWFGRRVAILAGLFMATCFGFLSHHGARSGDLDAQLTLISMLLLWQVPKLSVSSASRLWFGLLFGVAFLLKSFAIMPFAIASVIYLLWVDDKKTRVRDWLPALMVFVGIVGAWMLVRTIKDGTAYFVVRMTYEDLFLRATHEVDHGSRYAPWGYAASLFDRFAPWPVFIVVGWLYKLRGKVSASQPLYRLVMLWALVPLSLFSLAHTHHHWYLNPAYPAFAMLSAIALLNITKRQVSMLARNLMVGLLAVLLVACEVRVIKRCAHRDRMPPSQRFLSSLGKYNLRHGTPLQASFPLSHSERFILQVVCGFDVRDPETEAVKGAATPAYPTLSLSRMPSALQDSRMEPLPGTVLAQYHDLMLLKHDVPVTGLAESQSDINTATPNHDLFTLQRTGVGDHLHGRHGRRSRTAGYRHGF
jgi:4-amino-4-deoxy-L-arabinose transferase-like glycosyltransferase